MAQNWKAIAKHTGITIGEVAVLTGGIVLTKKFLDARILFQKQIAADPTYAEKWFVKHQGAVKLVGGAAAACFIKNPWLRMIAIGIAVEGAITEARVLTMNKETGLSFFEQIGAEDNSTSAIDEEMKAAALLAAGVGGREFTDRFPTQVAGFGDQYTTAVGWGGDFKQGATAGMW